MFIYIDDILFVLFSSILVALVSFFQLFGVCKCFGLFDLGSVLVCVFVGVVSVSYGSFLCRDSLFGVITGL
jgi:hypothetical protein